MGRNNYTKIDRGTHKHHKRNKELDPSYSYRSAGQHSVTVGISTGARRTALTTRWNAPAASRAAVVAVARADVIVGMHGAAMTHLLFAKQRAVAVELFSGTLISLRKGGGLWFFARYTKGYYGKVFLRRGPRQERSTLDAAQASRTVRCASEASAGPGRRAQRPSCDGVK